MVTDSILSAIIFKWAVINDVRVSRVLRVPGWMTSALLPCMLFKPPLFSLNTDAQPPAYTELAEMVAYELLISLSLFLCHIHTHTQEWEPGNKSPGAKHYIDPTIHLY